MTSEERKALRKLYREAFDLPIDLRHYECLCRDARRLGQPVWVVLMAILEKVYGDSIDRIDNMIDRPLGELRVKLERMRACPDRSQLLSQKRMREIEILVEAYPEELTRDDYLFFTNLFRKETASSDSSRIEDLVRRLSRKGKKGFGSNRKNTPE